MQTPINCLICHDPLVNKYNDYDALILYKNCRLRPGHIFSCTVYKADTVDEFVMRYAFTVSMSPIVSVRVYPPTRNPLWGGRISVSSEVPTYNSSFTIEPTLEIPYFEMDFSNYSKLYEKLKIYILFS